MHKNKRAILRIGTAAAFGLAFMLGGVGAGAVPTSTAGEVCLFNAPTGAPVKNPENGTLITNFGHIGWGYRVGTSDSWVFGATEDTGATWYIPPGANSKQASQSWHESGTYEDMLYAFGTGTLYDSQTRTSYNDHSGYYTRFRCSDVANSDPSAAASQVALNESGGYFFPSNNCLTKAVAVLLEYGMPMEPVAEDIAPNFYFTNLLIPPNPLGNGFSGTQYFTTLTLAVNLVDPLNGDYLNASPVHTQRPIRILVYQNNTLVYDSGFSAMATLTPTFNNPDRYQATLQLPTDAPQHEAVWSSESSASPYEVQVQLMYTERSYVPEVVNIAQGKNNATVDTPLTVGDINGDGLVNLQDYNQLIDCYSDLQPAKGPCNAQQDVASDLNDDGKVNYIDYNEMIRIFESQGGP